MKYRHILFDLDGTLTDSGPGIRNAVKHALMRFGIQENDEKNLNRFIGPVLSDSFRRFYNVSEDQLKYSESYFREYYSDKGIYENSVYDGVPECLELLKKEGFFLSVATSKPEFMAKTVLCHFGLDKYFDIVVGADREVKNLSKKEDIITVVISRSGIPKEESVMVGDRHVDAQGAHLCGIDCIGVLWGYGSPEEFCVESVVKTVKTPRELFEYIKG